MVFEPAAPGDYEHYLYSGLSHDLLVGAYSRYADGLAFDGKGDLYLAKERTVYKFDAGQFGSPAWEASVPASHGLAVDPGTGDAFIHAFKDNTFRRLDSSTGAQIESFPGGENQEENDGIAFNPSLVWQAGRPAGVVYAIGGAGLGAMKNGAVFSQPAVFPPRVDSESARGVGSGSASLGAEVNPGGYDTHYHFEYGRETCSAGGCLEAPVGGADLGSGQADLVASVALSGLQPETTYHYRVLATNAFGTVAGPDQTFTTYPLGAPGLPDGRAYELVSPPFKDGGEPFPIDPSIGSCGSECKPGSNSAKELTQVAPDGDGVVYGGFPFAASGDAVGENTYRSVRTASGWQTESLSPQLQARGGGGYQAVSADLSLGVLNQGTGFPPLTSEAPGEYDDLYLHEPDGSLQALLTSPPPNRSQVNGTANQFDLAFAGASSDFSHVIFAANDALTPATADAPAAVDGGPGGGSVRSPGSNEDNLYERVDGQLRLVNVLPGNTVTRPGATFGSGIELSAATQPGPDFSHAISDDGSRIFWTDEENTGRVYVRIDGEQTVEVPDSGKFLTASADGSEVLLNDGHLYGIYGSESRLLTDLTEGKGGFQGILGASEDLSSIYFVDTAALAAGASEQQCRKETGGEESGSEPKQNLGCNLYLFRGGETTFIATLSPSDENVSGDKNGGGESTVGDWEASPSERFAQVTPNGNYLAFVSEAELTGYDNDHLDEIFEYDAGSEKLICVSCNPAGVAPLGKSSLSISPPLGEPIFPLPRNLSENGRVFFDSSDVLSPYDSNGRIEDVYEYEPSGIGSCGRKGGCIFLISSGHATSDSNFLGASASGDDVFFTTRDRLVPEDQDDLTDVYDARMEGGFAALTAPACSGTGCQGVPGTPPIFATPSSVTFNGLGNFPPAVPSAKSKPKKRTVKCAKGKRSSQGRCVKRKAKKAKVKAKKTRTAERRSK